MKTLTELLSIPTCSGSETLIRDYIIEFANSEGLKHQTDDTGNIYITKGESDSYPCVVAHMDTVHFTQKDLVKNNTLLDIVSTRNNEKTYLIAMYNNKETGIGGDDKCGVYICLKMLMDKDVLKAAFFVEEEIGMLGSKRLDPTFFENVSYAIQFDGPTDNWFSVSCNGVPLWNEEFLTSIKPVLDSEGITNFSIDPFTDVVQLRTKFDFCCAVLSSGYHNQHSAKEYVIVEDVEKNVKIASKVIDKLGHKKYSMPIYAI